MRQFDCFYFLGSGYAYLSVMRIEAMAKQAVLPSGGDLSTSARSTL